MSLSLPKRLAIVASVTGVLVAAAWVYIQTHDIHHTWRQFQTGRPITAPRSRGGASVEQVRDIANTVKQLVSISLALAGAAGVTIFANRNRWRRRRSRTTATVELRLGRDDLANPYRVQEAFEGISGAISARWYDRLWRGQDHFALEIHRLADGGIRFTIAAPRHLLPAIRGPLEELYPDVALEPVGGRPPQFARVVRLKKQRLFVLSLQTTRDYEHSLVETLTSMMAAHEEPATVQLILAPASGRTHARARRLLKGRERSLQTADRRDTRELGIDSIVEAKELKGALETQHRSLLLFDLRIASNDAVVARRVAGLYAQARSENTLVVRTMRLRRRLYADRLHTALPNPYPSLRTGILSTSELATIWQLPRGRSKHAALERSSVRRAIAPSTINRDPESVLMKDERGPVSLGTDDRKFGHMLIGGQGGGKSSVLARHFANDARDPDRAVVLIDPKGPLAELCLGLVPEGRTVHYMDLGAPMIGINPLLVEASPGARAALFLRALIEASPPGSIQAASDSFLRQAVHAVCSVETEPTLWHVHRLLDPRDAGYRNSVITQLGTQPENDFATRYWKKDFKPLAADPSFAAQALNPPRNKLERLIATHEIDAVLRHPAQIDVDSIINGREILIVAGAKATVGEDNTILVTQLLLQLLHRALQGRQFVDQPVASPVSLLIDEAHNVLTPSVARLLAEGRSAGLEAVFGWQFSAQIRDELVRSGVRSLLQNISIFRMREMEDARSFAGLAMEIYSDRIGVDLEEQERLRFSADDILRLPAHHAINLWLADGIPRAGFLAETLPMEGLFDKRLAAHHAAAQVDRGGCSPGDLRDPVPEVKPAPKPPAESKTDTSGKQGKKVREQIEGQTSLPVADSEL